MVKCLLTLVASTWSHCHTSWASSSSWAWCSGQSAGRQQRYAPSTPLDSAGRHHSPSAPSVAFLCPSSASWSVWTWPSSPTAGCRGESNGVEDSLFMRDEKIVNSVFEQEAVLSEQETVLSEQEAVLWTGSSPVLAMFKQEVVPCLNRK